MQRRAAFDCVGAKKRGQPYNIAIRDFLANRSLASQNVWDDDPEAFAEGVDRSETRTRASAANMSG